MNDKVTATGMKVTATSAQSFLLISSANSSASAIQTENKTETVFSMTVDESKVLPSAHDAITKTSEAGPSTDASTASKWYYGYSNDPAKVDMDSTTKEYLKNTFAGYVIEKTVYVTVAKNSQPVKDLKVAATMTADDNKTITAAKVLVTSDTAATELSKGTSTSTVVLSSGNITDETVVELHIYIYIDGNDSSIYTNNITNLDTATIALTFTATTVAQNS